jgi:tRNA(fMet)-specific endonuclease VapC
MLDTSAVVGLIRGRSPLVVEHLATYQCDDWVLSSVVVAEMWYGVEHSRAVERNRSALRALLSILGVAEFGELAAQTYGRVRTDLERRGQAIGPLDTLIAAHAMSLDALLVTANLREFSHVDGLRLAGWGPPQ